jgi:hypothetical protein
LSKKNTKHSTQTITQTIMIKITRMIRFFLLQFVNIADGDLSTKFSGAFKISLAVSPILFIWDKIAKWGISNQDYILIVLMAILLDWFFGIIKHLQKRTFSFKKNASGLILKIALTVGAGMLFEGLNSIVKDSADIVVLSLTIVTRVIVFLYPAVSAWQNIYVVSGERFPPKAWMDRINKFNENLNVKELTDENE